MTLRSLTCRMTSTPDELWARLRDPAMSERRAALGGESSTVTVHDADGAGRLRVGIDTAVPESWMPAVVRGRLRGRSGFGLPTVRRVETWERVGTDLDTDRAGDRQGGATGMDDIDGWMSLDIHGAPGDASCEMHIAGAGEGSVVRYELSLTVNVPVVGRAIESAVLSRIEDVLERELEILDG